MAYRANPFLERMSERTTSDQEFVRLFSPKILERLDENVLDGALHIFRSPPGGGKTTLLRAFTPTALRAFWNARKSPEMSESHHGLVARGVLDEAEGPQLLGVLLSCASGYADLPPGASATQEGLFRALFDCRVVLRTLRSLATFLGVESMEALDSVVVSYDDVARDLKHIPTTYSAAELTLWAEDRERDVYRQLDQLGGAGTPDLASHVRFEGILWLQAVRFTKDGRPIAGKRLLMIDDVHRLRRKQRALLISELAELRPAIPVWLAERSIALGEQLLSQGVRQGRDVREYLLGEIWNSGRQQFSSFAQNILDRRLEFQSQIPAGVFSQYLRSEFQQGDVEHLVKEGIEALRKEFDKYQSKGRYSMWLSQADRLMTECTVDSLKELYVTRILLARDEGNRQFALELDPLSSEELAARDSSQVQGAAEILMHNASGVPYYFGIEKLCSMATSNVEELLVLAAAIYEGLQARQVLRKSDLTLSPGEQEKLLKNAAKHRRDFIPKNHTEGTRAQRLLDAIATFCRRRTLLANAPYAPGVTGVRLAFLELAKFKQEKGVLPEQTAALGRVVAECVAENLLVTRESAASTNRDSGTVFYLNRTICALYGLPLQMGGWQDISIEDLIEWMNSGRSASRQERLEIH